MSIVNPVVIRIITWVEWIFITIPIWTASFDLSAIIQFEFVIGLSHSINIWLGWINFEFRIDVDEIKEANICLLLSEKLIDFAQRVYVKLDGLRFVQNPYLKRDRCSYEQTLHFLARFGEPELYNFVRLEILWLLIRWWRSCQNLTFLVLLTLELVQKIKVFFLFQSILNFRVVLILLQ